MFAYIRKVENGVETTIQNQSYSGNGAGIWVDVKLINEDGKTTIVFDNKTVMYKIPTPDFTSGRIGLYTRSNSLWFDDVKVSAKIMENYIPVTSEDHVKPQITIYPNPVCGNNLFVRSNTPDLNAELMIYELSGRLI